jgi:hypothetical protein
MSFGSQNIQKYEGTFGEIKRLGDQKANEFGFNPAVESSTTVKNE